MNKTLLGIAVTAGVAALVLTLYVMGHPYIPQDAAFERDVQAVNWGPLDYAFRFFSWIGDAKGLFAEIVIFIFIIFLNRRAWVFAAGAVLTGAIYEGLVILVHRPRPAVPQVLRVTEFPGGSSYPSGHTMFVVTVVTVLMVCLGSRYLPRLGRIVGWVVAAVLVGLNAIGRMDVGAHWPTDVLAGILLAVFWLSLLASIHWVWKRSWGRHPSVPATAPEPVTD